MIRESATQGRIYNCINILCSDSFAFGIIYPAFKVLNLTELFALFVHLIAFSASSSFQFYSAGPWPFLIYMVGFLIRICVLCISILSGLLFEFDRGIFKAWHIETYSLWSLWGDAVPVGPYAFQKDWLRLCRVITVFLQILSCLWLEST